MDGPLLGIDQQLLTHGAAATSVVDAKVAGDAEQPEPEFFLSTRSPVEMFKARTAVSCTNSSATATRMTSRLRWANRSGRNGC